MDEKNCISCIKDAVTGECRNVKDKKARTSIEEITTKLNEVIIIVNGITGVDGGHLATDVDIANLQEQVTALQNSVNNLDDTYAKDIDITNLQTQVTALQNSVNNLDDTYAKDIDITNLQTQVTVLKETVDVLSGADTSHFATDEDIASLQQELSTLNNILATNGQNIENLQTDVNSLYNGFNAIDNFTYTLSERISSQDMVLESMNSIMVKLMERVTKLEGQVLALTPYEDWENVVKIIENQTWSGNNGNITLDGVSYYSSTFTSPNQKHVINTDKLYSLLSNYENETPINIKVKLTSGVGNTAENTVSIVLSTATPENILIPFDFPPDEGTEVIAGFIRLILFKDTSEADVTLLGTSKRVSGFMTSCVESIYIEFI